jgi:hypothetical protein
MQKAYASNQFAQVIGRVSCEPGSAVHVGVAEQPVVRLPVVGSM